MYRYLILLNSLLALYIVIPVVAQKAPVFKVVPLGVLGGLNESNLSAYLIAPTGSNAYICADAGTLYAGIQKAIHNKSLNGPLDSILKNQIKGYLISHPHLDHVSGLIINSPEDSPKPIYGFPFVIDALRDKYFTWQSWANFANEGDKPALKKYTYVRLDGTEISLANTQMSMQPFLLSHASPQNSSAFLIKSNNNSLLYLGDTGSDSLEHANLLLQLWQHIAPLIKNEQLKAIFIEVSFPNEQPNGQLFGHLTPYWLMHEMRRLYELTGQSLKQVPIVVTHIKPAAHNAALIRQQLSMENDLKLKLVFPVQGKELVF